MRGGKYGYYHYGNNTLAGGTGDDTIYMNSTTSVGSLYRYANGDGNDLIYGFTKNDTISVDDGADTIYNYFSDDSGRAKEYISIAAGAGNDSIYNWYGDSVTIDAGTGDDTIYNRGGDVIISAGDGDDSIKHEIGNTATIDGGAGNDTITLWLNSYATSISVNGGAGADRISISGGHKGLAVLGGTGNDTIYSGNTSGSIYKYYSGDGYDSIIEVRANDTVSIGGATYSRSTVGSNLVLSVTGGNGSDVFVYEGGNDLITDYRAGADKIQLTSGTISRSSLSGSNVVLTVGSGTLTVKDGKNKNITVIDSNGRETTQKYSTGGSSAMLFSDTNFIGGETNLDAITEKKYSVVNISAANFASLAQADIPTLAAIEK